MPPFARLFESPRATITFHSMRPRISSNNPSTPDPASNYFRLGKCHSPHLDLRVTGAAKAGTRREAKKDHRALLPDPSGIAAAAARGGQGRTNPIQLAEHEDIAVFRRDLPRRRGHQRDGWLRHGKPDCGTRGESREYTYCSREKTAERWCGDGKCGSRVSVLDASSRGRGKESRL